MNKHLQKVTMDKIMEVQKTLDETPSDMSKSCEKFERIITIIGTLKRLERQLDDMNEVSLANEVSALISYGQRKFFHK